MKFARIVFITAGAWGFLVLTPLFFLFDTIARLRASPISHPEFFYGFLAVAMVWQCAFIVIGSDPVRLRTMMVPSALEKFGYVLTMTVLFLQGRIAPADTVVIAPDFLIGILFVVAFAKTPRLEEQPSHEVLRTAIRT